MRRFFDRAAPRWDQMISPVPERLAALEAALAHLDPPERILDLGTGSGVAAVLLADPFPAAQVIGVDLSTPMIDIARSKVAPELGERVEFQVADAAALPFGNARFDSA